jgi:hypothetical protein
MENQIKTTEEGNEYQLVQFTDTSNPESEPLMIRVFLTTRPERLSEETFEEYKIRRMLNHKADKYNARGKVVWDSARLKTLNQSNLIKLAKSIQKFKEKHGDIN